MAQAWRVASCLERDASHLERAQFAGLNENINNLTAQVDGLIGSDGMTDRITDLSARNVDAFATLTLTISNPPTQAQVQAVLDKLNELIAGLHH